MDRALFHVENAYKVGVVSATGYVCRTNLASHTAFRGFGGPQVRHRYPQMCCVFCGCLCAPVFLWRCAQVPGVLVCVPVCACVSEQCL